MSSFETPKPKRPMDVPHLRKLGLITIVSVILYVTHLIIATHPDLTENQSTMIFSALMGSCVFTWFLMLAREIKQWKKLQN